MDLEELSDFSPIIMIMDLVLSVCYYITIMNKINKGYGRDGKPYQKYTVEILGREFVVDTRDDQEAHTMASHMYMKEVPDCTYSLLFLQDSASHLKHSDGRYIHPEDKILSILELEAIREKEEEEDKLIDDVRALQENKRTRIALEEKVKELLKTI